MDFLKVSVIVLFVILTILTVKIHPEIHQPMLIEDADFKLVRISDTISSENIPVSVAQPQPKTITQSTPQKTVAIKVQEAPTQNQNVQTTNTSPHSQTPVETKPVKIKFPKKEVPIKTKTPEPQESQIEILQKLLNTDIEDSKALQENAQKLAQTIQPQPAASTHKNPYMTEQEEIIAWSKWRSDIQNQIMRDSSIEQAPLGTIFTFTFVVDKFGNVSNIKVTCSNPNYMAMARNNMKPAIARLQRKPILNFPRGTQRTSTVVTGAIILGTFERYSTPADYNDFERVVH